MTKRRSLFCIASLRRIISSGNYIPEIDGLRFVAIVYLTHNLAITGAGVLVRRVVPSPVLPVWEKSTITYLVAGILVLTIGFFLYLTVERPTMDKSWPDKLLRRLRSAIPEMDSYPAKSSSYHDPD